MIIKSVLKLMMLFMAILGIGAVMRGKDEKIYNVIFMALLYIESDSFFIEILAIFTFTILFFRMAIEKDKKATSK